MEFGKDIKCEPNRTVTQDFSTYNILIIGLLAFWWIGICEMFYYD